MNLSMFEFLDKEVPSSVGDIRDALDLLLTSIDTAIEQVGEKAKISIDNKEYNKVNQLIDNRKELDSIGSKIQEAIVELDTIIESRCIEESKKIDEVDEKLIPNYSDYLVDMKIEHNLYEDLTHKRPCAFKIDETRIDIKDWKGALVQTIDYLAQKDSSIVRSFVDDYKMNGKKRIYFSRVKLPTMI